LRFFRESETEKSSKNWKREKDGEEDERVLTGKTRQETS